MPTYRCKATSGRYNPAIFDNRCAGPGAGRPSKQPIPSGNRFAGELDPEDLAQPLMQDLNGCPQPPSAPDDRQPLRSAGNGCPRATRPGAAGQPLTKAPYRCQDPHRSSGCNGLGKYRPNRLAGHARPGSGPRGWPRIDDQGSTRVTGRENLLRFGRPGLSVLGVHELGIPQASQGVPAFLQYNKLAALLIGGELAGGLYHSSSLTHPAHLSADPA